MLGTIKAFLSRYKRWIFGIAVVLKVINVAGGGIVEHLPAIGGLLNGLSSVALLVGAGFFLRWIARRFLFTVSRRLGLAFLFVGVFPLFWFALFVLGVGATVVLHLASHDSHATLEEFLAETDLIAERAARAALSAPSPEAFREGWQSLAGLGPRPDTRAFVWVGPPPGESRGLSAGESETGKRAPGVLPIVGVGAPPAWARAEPFRGVVAFADSVRLAAVRPGALADGRPFLAMVVEPLDERLADRIRERTGIEATRLDAEKVVAGWRAAPADTLPASPGDVEAAEGGGSSDEAGSSFTMSLGSSDATSVLTARVLDWSTGDDVVLDDEDGRLEIVPLYELEFEPRAYIRAHFTDTGQGTVLWLITKWLGITTIVMMLLATIIGVVLTASVTRAVNAIHRGTKRVAEGDLDHRIHVKSKDQLGALATSFNEMTDSVRRLLEVKAEKDRLVHEMEIAAEVQRTMLPERFPTIPGLEGAARCMMAKEVGGDFYDFITITPQRIGLAVGDVSGKGVSAALVMSNVMSSLRSLLAAEPSRGPADLLTHLNRILHRATAPDRFVTLFYAEYDLSTASLSYANAGHDWPMIVSPEGQIVLDLESSGLMLGALPEVSLTEHEIKLEPGDVVVAYSDGLVDTVNESDEPFERDRAQAVIAEHVADPPQRLVEAVASRLREWQGTADDVDDVTIVVLKRVPLPGEKPATLEAAGAARTS